MRKKYNRYASEKACQARCRDIIDELGNHVLELAVVAHDARIYGVSKNTLGKLAEASSWMVKASDILCDACGEKEGHFADSVVEVEEPEEVAEEIDA